ncbi:MAG: glycosyltransferase family 4 protein [Chryseolinea sp.]
MRVIFFTKYTRQGASSRLRTFLYLDFLREEGIYCKVSPFFNDAYLQEVYKYKRHNKWLSFLALVNRIKALATVPQYDRVVIEKELFPYFPSIFEWILKLMGVRYVVDYDDAIWHNYDSSPNHIIRFLLGHKIQRVMRYSGTVLSGNEYLADMAKKSGAKRITYLPTVIDIERYSVKNYKTDKKFTIGWIGSPITHKYLAALKRVFKELSEKYHIRIKLVGASNGINLPDLEELVHWSEEIEVREIQTFNVGIMPLEDNIWERGKCGYKLIQYMGCGVPVVGTPLGVNRRIIVDGVNGFVANTAAEWYTAIEKLIVGGIELERTMGTAGRLFVEQHYSLQAHRKRYLEEIERTE